MLLLGFLCKGNSDIRDYLLSEKAHDILGKSCMKLLESTWEVNDEMECIYHAWTLSILAGATLPPGQKISDLSVLLQLADIL